MSATPVLQGPQGAQSVPGLSGAAPAAAQISVVAGENKAKPTAAGIVVPPPPPVLHSLQTHYDELLRVIAEVGKDVKPAYTNSKISADRLKRNIAVGRSVLRDCLLDIERLNQTHADK